MSSRLRFALAACAALLVAQPALAQDEPDLAGGLKFSGAPTPQEILAQQRACEARKPPRKPAGALNESTYRRLERIMDSISKNQYGDAEAKLNELAGMVKSDYEKAIIQQTIGFVYASTNREMLAVKAFEQAVATNAMPQQVHEQMMFNIAQLYITDDKFDQGIERLNAYLAESCNPIADAHILLASVHAEKKRWRESLKQVDLAIVKSKAPKESWLQLKLALHYELKEYPRCAEVLVHLVATNPVKEDYFKQLADILIEISKEPEAMAVLALAERRGYIDKENEYRSLASLYLHMQIPLKAATILERGVSQKQVEATEKNLEMLANAWIMAREWKKAEEATARAAAASEKGELYKRLGQVQMETENWKAAIGSFQKALKKGGLKDTGEVALLLGIAAMQDKQFKTAESALRQAQQHEKTTKMATEWLGALQAELAYQEAQQAPEEEEATQTN